MLASPTQSFVCKCKKEKVYRRNGDEFCLDCVSDLAEQALRLVRK